MKICKEIVNLCLMYFSLIVPLALGMATHDVGYLPESPTERLSEAEFHKHVQGLIKFVTHMRGSHAVLFGKRQQMAPGTFKQDLRDMMLAVNNKWCYATGLRVRIMRDYGDMESSRDFALLKWAIERLADLSAHFDEDPNTLRPPRA